MAYAHSEAANPHWARQAKLSDLSHIPGESGPPIIGTTLRVLRDPAGYGAYMVQKYGPVFRANAFGIPTVNMVGAEANELLLFDRDKNFSSEQGWGPVLNLLFPRGLMLMDFDHHRMDRRAVRQPYHRADPLRHHWYRCRQGHRRPGAGVARHAGHQPGQDAEVCTQLPAGHPRRTRGHGSLCAGREGRQLS